MLNIRTIRKRERKQLVVGRCSKCNTKLKPSFELGKLICKKCNKVFYE